jgi:molybdopterin converting factor small subunit
MKTRLLVWAQAKEILGFDEKTIEIDPKETPEELFLRLFGKEVDLSFCRVAVNQTMHPWDAAIGEAQEIAIIPPVSGG